MNSGATINSLNTSDAPSGNITITAIGPVALSDNLTGIFSNTSSTNTRPAGDISLQAKSITVTNGALIQSGSNQEPQGGSVTLTGNDSITISARGGVSTQAQDQDVGPISISTPMLLLDNGFVSASTLGTGHGGNITLQVGTLNLTHGGQIASSTEGAAT